MSVLRQTAKRVALRLWRDLPLPRWARRSLLRGLNPTFLVGAVALIQDPEGRVLLLEHTYRTQAPWGLPGGWLRQREDPKSALVREVFEETGMDVEVQALAAADLGAVGEIGLLYRCRILAGEFRPSEETVRAEWFPGDGLPALPSNQARLLALARVGLTGKPPGPAKR
jgi:8-oxo-dGTP diphosphatase